MLEFTTHVSKCRACILSFYCLSAAQSPLRVLMNDREPIARSYHCCAHGSSIVQLNGEILGEGVRQRHAFSFQSLEPMRAVGARSLGLMWAFSMVELI